MRKGEPVADRWTGVASRGLDITISDPTDVASRGLDCSRRMSRRLEWTTHEKQCGDSESVTVSQWVNGKRWPWLRRRVLLSSMNTLLILRHSEWMPRRVLLNGPLQSKASKDREHEVDHEGSSPKRGDHAFPPQE